MGRVSTIIPAYNAEKYLGAAIESALKQTYADREVIVVNDGSADGTERVALGYAGKIKYLVQPNKGVSAARNAGVAAATGEWIAFLDADDLWDPEKLEVQMRSGGGLADVIHCAARTIDAQGKILTPNRGQPPPAPLTFLELVADNRIDLLTVVMRKQWFESVGGMDAENRLGAEDWQCWLRLALKGCSFHYVDQVLASYRIHGTQTSRNLMRMSQGLVYVLDKLKVEFGATLKKEEMAAIQRQYGEAFSLAAYTLCGEGRYNDSLGYCLKGLRANLLSRRCWVLLVLCLLPFRSRLIRALRRLTARSG